MGNSSSRKGREIVPGDHLYTPRGCYDHHVIYIGESRIIHFQNSLDDKALGSSIRRFGECSVCGHHSGRSGVVQSCLDCFRRGGKMYFYGYGYRGRIPASQLKRCTSATSDPPEIVVGRAKDLLKHGFGDYSLVTKNCEHFALFCKTGKHMPSGQVISPLMGFVDLIAPLSRNDILRMCSRIQELNAKKCNNSMS